MGKNVSPGVVLGTVLLVAVAGFTVAYLGFGVFRGDRGLDLWLLLAWVAVIVMFVVALRMRSRTREELARRFFLSEDGIYNHELGYAPLPEPSGDDAAMRIVTFAADSLAAMSYGFKTVEQPRDFEPKMIIATTVLKYHWAEGAGGTEDENADDTEGAGVVIDRWEGSLLRIAEPGNGASSETLGTFHNACELALLLEGSGILPR